MLYKTCLVYWSFDPWVCSLVCLMLNYLLIDLLFMDKTCVFQHSFIFRSIIFSSFSGFESDQIVFFLLYFTPFEFQRRWLETRTHTQINLIWVFQQYGEIHTAQFTYCFFFPAKYIKQELGLGASCKVSGPLLTKKTKEGFMCFVFHKTKPLFLSTS